jgi:hypothetical protein
MKRDDLSTRSSELPFNLRKTRKSRPPVIASFP